MKKQELFIDKNYMAQNGDNGEKDGDRSVLPVLGLHINKSYNIYSLGSGSFCLVILSNHYTLRFIHIVERLRSSFLCIAW